MRRTTQYYELINGIFEKRTAILFKEEEELRGKLLPLYIEHSKKEVVYNPPSFPYFTTILYSLLLTITSILLCVIH
jgi:hypothetical protein